MSINDTWNRLKGHKRSLLIYHNLFDSEDGRDVLADLASRFRVFGTTFDPESDRASAFNEGARNVVLDIIKRARTSPETVLARLEQTEAHDRRSDI